MSIAFFVSSIGDTDLAKATINKLIEKGLDKPIYLIPITSVAEKRTEDLMAQVNIKRIKLAEILKQDNLVATQKLSQEQLLTVNAYIRENKIEHGFIGVPSPLDEDMPYQIAQILEIPCTIAYEYMFTAPEKHHFWNNLPLLANKTNCDYAVPLPLAKDDILKFNADAQVYTIGHLSIDQAMVNKTYDNTQIKNSLLLKGNENLIFISGTTQPPEIDSHFVEAILSEIATGKFPQLQIRFGIHPGVKDLDNYLNLLLKICEKYPHTASQFKLILPSQLEERLQRNISPEQPFILRANITGAEASFAADKIAQAVPGALVNEAAIKGKPSYFHEQVTSSYLPKSCFANNITSFFKAKQQLPLTRHDLNIGDETAAMNMANVFMKSKC